MDIDVPVGKDSKVKIQREVFLLFFLSTSSHPYCHFNIFITLHGNRNQERRCHGCMKLDYIHFM